MIEKKNLFQRIQQAINNQRNDIRLLSTQESLPFDTFDSNGVVTIGKNTYSKSLRFSDVGYQLSKDEDKTRIFSLYCSLLNWFDPAVRFQFSFINCQLNQVHAGCTGFTAHFFRPYACLDFPDMGFAEIKHT